MSKRTLLRILSDFDLYSGGTSGPWRGWWVSEDDHRAVAERDKLIEAVCAERAMLEEIAAYQKPVTPALPPSPPKPPGLRERDEDLVREAGSIGVDARAAKVSPIDLS